MLKISKERQVGKIKKAPPALRNFTNLSASTKSEFAINSGPIRRFLSKSKSKIAGSSMKLIKTANYTKQVSGLKRLTIDSSLRGQGRSETSQTWDNTCASKSMTRSITLKGWKRTRFSSKRTNSKWRTTWPLSFTRKRKNSLNSPKPSTRRCGTNKSSWKEFQTDTTYSNSSKFLILNDILGISRVFID